MRGLKHYDTAVLTGVLLYCLLPGAATAQTVIARQVDTAKKCAICHYRWVAAFFLEGRSTPIAPADAPDDVVGRPEMCLSCHDGSVRDSRDKICNDPGHRVGVKPSNRVKIPGNFPLDDNGCMQCTTCHTPHAVPQREGHLVDFFLRAPNRDSSFCKLCHEDHAGGRAAGNHPLDVAVPQPPPLILRSGGMFGGEQGNRIVCETCHIAHGGVNSSFLVLPVEDTRTLSILCEACHTRHPGRKTARGSGFSHPVDVQSGGNAAIPVRWPTGETVHRGINGELVCRTCHRPHQASGGRTLLTGPAGKDAQCLCCHQAQASVRGTLHDLTRRASGSTAGSGVCSSCHAVHEAPLKEYLWAAPLGRPFLSERDKEIARGKHNLMVSLCTGCHSSGGTAQSRVPREGLHPDFFFQKSLLPAPVRSSPEVFLADAAGARSDHGGIVCATCHTAHEQRLSAAGGFLRPSVPQILCAACHGSEALLKYLRFHSSVLRERRSHLFAPSER